MNANFECLNSILNFLKENKSDLITSFVSIVGIGMTIKHNTKMINRSYEENRKIEYEKEIKNNRPYFVLEYKTGGTGIQSMYYIDDNIDNTNDFYTNIINIKNIGMNAALGVTCKINYRNHFGKTVVKDVFEYKRIMKVHSNESDLLEINFGFIDKSDSRMLTILFQDLLNNNYEQHISLELIDNSKLTFESHVPILIK